MLINGMLWIIVIVMSLFYIGNAAQDNCGAAEMRGAVGEECKTGENHDLLWKENHHQFYIKGAWVNPNPPLNLLPVHNPSTGKSITSITLGSQHDVNAAVLAAREAFKMWSQETTPSRRRDYVSKLMEEIQSRWEEMAVAISVEMGAPISMSRSSQVGGVFDVIQSFLDSFDNDFHMEYQLNAEDQEDDTTIVLEPIGVVALITPWNWPLYQIVLKVIPALLTGCTCVLKPSELSPLSALLFAEMIHSAGFPPGVFNLVNGDGPNVGQQLSHHPDVDMVSFTGSSQAGAKVSAAAAKTFKRTSLEMGGKGANILFADYFEDTEDVEEVVEDGVNNAFSNSGQNCNAPTRMLVEESIYQLAVTTAMQVAEELEVGSASEEGDHLGPLVSETQYERVQRYIQSGIDEGAKLVAGGTGKPDGVNPQGYYAKPTVFVDCDSTMTMMKEEIFGPVLCIAPFSTEKEALDIANDTRYGLTNYVHSSDPDKRRRMVRGLQSGMVEMNGVPLGYGAPFGGVKASGNSREGGLWGLEDFCIVKAVSGLTG